MQPQQTDHARATEAITGAQTRHVRFGPATAVFEAGALRWVRIGKTEVLRGIYLSVRDKDWGTVEPVVSCIRLRVEPRNFEARFLARHRLDGVEIRWLGQIVGSDRGDLTFSARGRACSDGLASRIGFCVLHPSTMAGALIEARTPRGRLTVRLPRHIAPDPPITDVLGLGWDLPGLSGRAILDLEGDRFEMEDQRNWTDASFKTYSRPLSLPYPFVVRRGATFGQTVRLRLENVSERSRRRPSGETVGRIVLSGRAGRPLPAIGYGITMPEGAPRPREIELLRAVRPAHIRLVLDLRDPVWPHSLERGGEIANALGGAGLELEVIAPRDSDSSFRRLAAVVALARPRVTCVFPFDAETSISTRPLIQGIRRAFEAANIHVRVGGGSRTDFAQINRSALSSEAMDVAGYPISPQVHAFDEASMLETLAIQGETVRCVRRSLPGLAVFVGPVTLKPRLLDDKGPRHAATSTSPDPRQGSVFAACWTLGSIRALADAGAASLTYFELTGPAGLISTDAVRAGATTPMESLRVFPLYHIFADLAERAWRVVGTGARSDSGVQVLGLADGVHQRLLIANTGDQAATVDLLQLSVSAVAVRTLSAETASDAMNRPRAFRSAGERVRVRSGRVRLDLPATTVTRIDA
jgi:hypothetical protein